MNLKFPVFYLIVISQVFALLFGCSQSSLNNVTKIEDFSLLDYEGNNHMLSDYSDENAIVILFVATECPISNAYNSRMQAIYEDYKDKSVAFLGINSNKAEDVESIRLHANENGLEFTILKDAKNIIADKFNASVTPEVYVLNNDFSILYHGRIDNSRDESQVESQDLRNALDEILAGEKVSTPSTKAFGCTIKRI